jgi:type I restriction-modification system DNA methylase subunit
VGGATDQSTSANDLYEKINPFDWKQEFPEVFARKDSKRRGDSPVAAGFDAVIGNPPWGATFTEQELAYHKVKNQEIIVRMIDSFMYFFYQSSTRLNAHGTLGMILPDVILYQSDNLKLRQYVLEKFTIRTILNMGDVFHKVTRPASILIIEKGSNSKNQVTVADFSAIRKEDKESAVCDPSNFKQFPQHLLGQLPGKLFITSALDKYQFVNKISAVPHESLKTLTDQDGIQRGVSPDLKEAFIVSSATAHDRNLEGSKLRNILTGGRHVKRFFIDHPDLRLIYTTRNDDFSKLPNICAFIDTFRESITCREVSQGKHPLYSLHRPSPYTSVTFLILSQLDS